MRNLRSIQQKDNTTIIEVDGTQINGNIKKTIIVLIRLL